MSDTVAGGYPNLRGATVQFVVDGRNIRGVVVTHTRGNRWVIQAGRLPASYARPDGSRRIVLDRDEFDWLW